ncbi:hypothetical protein HCN44_004456 [Aphidius gifuensis]|uniref:PEHE domain-containing protein n=1 Tax=Aphidius gifuensis TaxID=684658 RepID=A0A835CTF0_APHGI|nr:uncharacterized protein DDB_G0283357-like [Aphidius gifuensis]XP_044002994.1 uncharacterized protein DDB_G0283357-like [Aphidius gifuensis]KAF7994984.1 hypothetical protein HCN44_004456 [Aphidius gifuensis]
MSNVLSQHLIVDNNNDLNKKKNNNNNNKKNKKTNNKSQYLLNNKSDSSSSFSSSSSSSSSLTTTTTTTTTSSSSSLQTIESLSGDCFESLSSSSSSSILLNSSINNKLKNKKQDSGKLKAATAAYNMVAAMNDHLSTSSTTNSGRTSAHERITNDFTTGCQTIESENIKSSPPAGILTFPCDFDHMYASMTDGTPATGATATSTLGVSSPLRGNDSRNNELCEIKHLKELLLLHLDLIQQQSEQIVTKDKLLSALRQENETLKLRIERMDRRVNLQKLRSESTENSVTSDNTGPCSPPNLHSVSSLSNNTGDYIKTIQTVDNDNNSQPYNESFKIRLNTSGGITTVKQEPIDNKHDNDKQNVIVNDETRLDWDVGAISSSGGGGSVGGVHGNVGSVGIGGSSKKKRRSDPLTPTSGGGSSSSKRKRGVSCSSTISNDTTSTIPENKSITNDNTIHRKFDKKGKSLVKKESYLTTENHYYTAIGDPNYQLKIKSLLKDDDEEESNLEVPSWRVKVYTSCYTMEGTENLDDEIFNKRHLKLENDERRRKRWDVQRIREQRHIEKLKQRQERQNHLATCYNTNHTGPCPTTAEEEIVTTLWPEIDQIQSLQVDPQLPVAAFGAPIPSFTPSEFSLPWLLTTNRLKNRRPKRSSSGRRKSRR